MQDPLGHDVPVVILVVIMGLVGVVVSASCSWMTHKKRRVGGHSLPRGDGLMLHVSGKTCSSHAIAPSRYSTPSPVVILPISSLAHSLVTPTIIITPPSPLAILAETSSIQSNSSIGSAGDLLIEDEATHECDEIQGEEPNEDFCGDSLAEEKTKRGRKRFIEIDQSPHFTEPVLCHVGQCDIEISNTIDYQETVTVKSKSKNHKDAKRNSSKTSKNSWTQPHTITINVVASEHAADLRKNLDEVQGHSASTSRVRSNRFDPVVYAPRARLKSMEPGTKKSDFHFHRNQQQMAPFEV